MREGQNVLRVKWHREEAICHSRAIKLQGDWSKTDEKGIQRLPNHFLCTQINWLPQKRVSSERQKCFLILLPCTSNSKNQGCWSHSASKLLSWENIFEHPVALANLYYYIIIIIILFSSYTVLFYRWKKQQLNTKTSLIIKAVS
jgi:hypothetical protein